MSTISTIDCSEGTRDWHLYEDRADDTVRLRMSNSKFSAYPAIVIVELSKDVIEAIAKSHRRGLFPHQQEEENMGLKDDVPRCKSCGKPYVEHLGVQGTCALLLQARGEIDALKAEAKRLREVVKTLEDEL